MLVVAGVVEAIDRMHAQMDAIRDELNAVDRMLGDGDTGMTVSAIVDAWTTIAPTLPEEVGAALVLLGRATSRASGSSLGAVLATGLGAAGRTAGDRNAIDRDGVVAMLAAAVTKITERSGAHPGDKSFLDSIVCIERALAADSVTDDLLPASLQAARAALVEFRDRESRLGRARIYGARSVGLEDPGMKAVVLLLAAASGGRAG